MIARDHRLAPVIAWIAATRRKVLEVVPTDVVAWDVQRTVPSVRVRDGVAIERFAPQSTWQELMSPKQAAQVRAFLDRHDTGYLATSGGRLAGWIWLSRRTHRDPWSGLWIRLAADEAYSYALWVAPEYRPGGTAAGLVAAMLSDVQTDETISRVYGWVDESNRESQTLLRLVFGFTPVQRVKRIHLLRRFGWKVPRSDEPAFGPLSTAGRHASAPARPREP